MKKTHHGISLRFRSSDEGKLLSNLCVAFTILFIRPNARLLQKELGKKLQLSFFNKFYYLLFLDRELTLSFARFCYHHLFTFASSPLLFVSFSIFDLLIVVYFVCVIFAIVIVIPSLPFFPCFV